LEPVQSIEPNVKTWNNVRLTLYILGAFLLFLFALDLMTSSLQHMGKNVAETILQATSNPFTALFIGLLITAMLQSSSTTTSLVVALVASGSLTLQSATPIIMGANVGTTITSTIVSLGFINKKKEFRRAVAAGTYHDFFNILTVVILFPLEYYYGFLSSLAGWISNLFFTPSPELSGDRVTHFWFGFSPITNFLIANIPSPFFLAAVAVALLFASILIFRKLISGLLRAKSPEVFSRFFFKSELKSFVWGLLTTAAIRSSTITTSVVVPIVAQKIVKLKQAAPFILGANIGTTITAFIAAFLNSNTSSVLSIAIVHFLFNFIGVLIFFPLPVLRKLPLGLANWMGKLTLKYRLAGLVYLLTTFFFLPFSLIYLNQDSFQTLNLVYEQPDTTNNKTKFRMVVKRNLRTESGSWTRFEGDQDAAPDVNAVPSLIYPVSVKNNTLFVGKEMFLFNRPGFCWDGENEQGKFQSCIEAILPSMKVSNMTFDSVYVCRVLYTNAADSLTHKYYVSAPYKIYLQREVISPQHEPRVIEKLVRFETQ
jgi:solute carrier family 34 (sodium-dependent phosphate cotransporter)